MGIIKEYAKIQAEDFLCVPACLESILIKYNFNISQYVIAEYFGIHVPFEYTGPIQNVLKTSNCNEWGINLKIDSLNNFFSHFSLPLYEKYINHRVMDELSFLDIILNASSESGTDIICGYDYGMLHNSEYGIGHVSIIMGTESENIVMFDPGPKDPGIKTYLLYDTLLAIKKKNDGLWIINKKNYA